VRTLPTSGRDEFQQVGVEPFFVRVGETVRAARVDLQGRILEQLCGGQGRRFNRNNLFIVTVDYHRRHIELFQILGEIGFGERLDTVEGILVAMSLPFQGWLERP
jgi:hypothetical protein